MSNYSTRPQPLPSTPIRGCRSAGFSLIDILISLGVGVVLFTVISEFFVAQIELSSSQQQLARTQQNMRLGMEIMFQEVLLAGLDPSGTAGAGFTEAVADSIEFSQDLNGDGDLLDEDESVSYNLTDKDQDGDMDLVRTSSTASDQLVISNVESLTFEYTLLDGSTTSTPSDLTAIRHVRISTAAQPWPESVHAGGSPLYRTGYTEEQQTAPVIRRVSFSRNVFLRNMFVE